MALLIALFLASATAVAVPAACGGAPLRVHFYDVAQGLSVLVDLPDGRHILVDTGDQATRAGCGAPCRQASAHLLDRLVADLHGDPIALLWITHQHSDHLGGVPAVLAVIPVSVYVDDGRDLSKPPVERARAAASDHGAKVVPVSPEHTESPIPSTVDVKVTPVVPSEWPGACPRNANDCSIGLRIDYCASSMLFTGDAEREEEATLDVAPVTLLQVGHHGSATSTSSAFLAKAKPTYAVISAGKPGEGTNRTYCHPRAQTVTALTKALGGPGVSTITAFDGEVPCSRRAGAEHWIQVPASDRLWETSRDGDVVLVTTGDGVFRVEGRSSAETSGTGP
jgi:competence protein ComEC